MIYDEKKNKSMKEQSKDAKRFLKIKDKEVSSLINQNDKIIKNMRTSSTSSEEIIPISNLIIESDKIKLNLISTYFEMFEILFTSMFL